MPVRIFIWKAWNEKQVDNFKESIQCVMLLEQKFKKLFTDKKWYEFTIILENYTRNIFGSTIT